MLDHTYPASRIDRIDVVVDHNSIHKAKAVHQWLEKHPRFELLWLPTGLDHGIGHFRPPKAITARVHRG
jgi:hypothetical protein